MPPRRKTHWSLDAGTGVATCDMPLGDGLAGWRAIIDLVSSGSELVVSSFAIAAEPGAPVPGHGVTARMLRTVRLGELLEEAQRHIAVMSAHSREVLLKDTTAFVGATATREPTLSGLFPGIDSLSEAKPSQPGPPRRQDVIHAMWAARYVEHKAISRTPIADLAARYDLKSEQVRDLVHEARRRGMLTPTRQGAAGGGLTDKARAVLTAAESEG